MMRGSLYRALKASFCKIFCIHISKIFKLEIERTIYLVEIKSSLFESTCAHLFAFARIIPLNVNVMDEKDNTSLSLAIFPEWISFVCKQQDAAQSDKNHVGHGTDALFIFI